MQTFRFSTLVALVVPAAPLPQSPASFPPSPEISASGGSSASGSSNQLLIVAAVVSCLAVSERPRTFVRSIRRVLPLSDAFDAPFHPSSRPVTR